MKIPFRFIALVLVSVRLVSAIPENVSGFIYRETTTFGRDSFSRAYELGPDGRFTGLYSYFRTGSSITSPASTLDHTGTFTYRRTDANTAVLIFSDDKGAPPLTRTLSFSSDANGTSVASATIEALGGTFSLVSIRPSAPLLNSSNRSFIRAGGTAYSGFVLSSQSVVLLRAVGPSLSAFGVQGALRDPKLSVVSAEFNSVAAMIDNVASEAAQAVRRVGSVVGAFPLPENSKDSAMILPLRAGAYIAQVSSVDPADSGEVLIEIYLLP